MAELIQKRYGTALFELAQESNRLEEMESEVEQLISILSVEKEFLEVLGHPQVSLSDKRNLIDEVFKDQISNDLLGLMDLILQKHRQSLLLPILNDFMSRVKDYRGILTVNVTVSQPLSEIQRNQLIQRLQDVTHKSISITENVDETLIGGLVVRIGDRIVDSSIKGMFSKMRKQMLTDIS